MPFTPDAPFPKSQGDNIRSKDWNDAVNELRRLDTAKLDLAGGRITGPLNIDGPLGIGTTTPKYLLNFANVLGDKISLWGNGDPHYGFGIQSGLLQIHTDGAGADIAFGHGPSANFTETARIKGNGRVGIGVSNPEFTLETDGRIRLRQGSTGSAGLWLWQSTPKNDRAFVGLVNDEQVGFWGNTGLGWGLVMNTTNGNVGIGTLSPGDRLEVNGGLKILTGTNPIRFTSAWSSFPDNATDKAEICNDTGTFKTLMIVGNKSAGLGRRVSVWDRLEVNGVLETQKRQLGNKWMLSGVGDAHGNDGWLRLFSADGKGYSGGFAAGRVWAETGKIEGSDLRLKKEVTQLGDAACGVLALRGVRFKWRAPGEEESFRLGLIAQEVEEVFPELVETGPGGMKGIYYSGLIAPLIETVKQQHREIAELRAELRGLQGQMRARQRTPRGRA